MVPAVTERWQSSVHAGLIAPAADTDFAVVLPLVQDFQHVTRTGVADHLNGLPPLALLPPAAWGGDLRTVMRGSYASQRDASSNSRRASAQTVS